MEVGKIDVVARMKIFLQYLCGKMAAAKDSANF